MKNRKRGFTLIELLVVVLIIGILAAVALPQYQIAVQKARTMSLLPLLRAISDAETLYFLENGTYTRSFQDLTIEMPAGGALSQATGYAGGGDKLTYGNFVCLLRGDTERSSAYCYDDSRSDAPKIEKYFHQDFYVCWSFNSNYAHRVCQSISGRTTSDRGTGVEGSTNKGYSFR